MAFLSMFLAAPCIANGLDDYYQMLEWRNIGPNKGGRSIAVAGSSQRKNEYYFGATGGGLWKTTDGGTTWSPVTDGQISSSSIGAVAIDPTNPDIVYVGMGEGQLRANVMQGDGLYKSVDGGQTWQHMGLRDTKVIDTIRINPENPDIVYAAALGDPYTPNEERGVFRSPDGGKTWQKILYRSAEAGAIDLAMDPNDPDVLIATLWQVYRKPWKLWSGGPKSGIFKSMDGGDTWTDITRNPGLPSSVLGKMTVAISGADSNRIYANIEATDGGLYRSDDGGETWDYVNGDRKLWQRSFYFLQVRADPNSRDTVYVLSFQLEKSTDGGESFEAIPTHHPDFHDLWIDPQDSNRMIVGDDGGGSVTVNGGASWTEQDYPTAQIYRVTTTNDFPFHVCGAQQDNDTVCVASRSGMTDVYAGYYTVSHSESGYVTAHPDKPDIFFSGATNALTRFDRATGRVQDVQPFPYTVMGEPAEDMPERWNWTYPIVFAPQAPHALYVGSQHVWRSVDEGETWEKISPDLTRADPATLGTTGGPILADQDGPEVYATIYTIAPSPKDSDVIWTGSDDGLVHVTQDGGQNWNNVTPQDLPVNAEVQFIDASNHEQGTAYVIANRVKLGDRAAYVWKTGDFGTTWGRIDASLPAGNFAHGIRADTEQPGLLYLGTEHGVFVSFDDGEEWHSLSLNLPDVRVSSLEVKNNELVIATHGRSFYVLDGLATLRQLARNGVPPNDVLLGVGVGYRPSVPVQVDFFLQKKVGGIHIEILNDAGDVIRNLDLPPESNTAGAHRVTWDLRHDGATVFDGIILEGPSPSIGPMAIPGNYTVRISADENILLQNFMIRQDPNMQDVSEDELREQLEFALRVRNATSVANETVIEIRNLRSKIVSRIREQDQDIRNAAAAVLEHISAIEAELYQVRNQSPKDKIAFPIKLNNRFSGLLGMLALGDGAPTRSQYMIYERLEHELQEILALYQRTRAEDLTRLNGTLHDSGLAPVSIF